MNAQALRNRAENLEKNFTAFPLKPWQQGAVALGRLAFYSFFLSGVVLDIYRYTTFADNPRNNPMIEVNLFCFKYLALQGFALIILAIHPFMYRNWNAAHAKSWALLLGWLSFTLTVAVIIPLSLSELIQKLEEDYPFYSFLLALGPVVFLAAGGVVPNPYWPIFRQRVFLVRNSRLEVSHAP